MFDAGDRLGGLDQAFLAVEDAWTPMNVGTCAVFEGPAPRFDVVRDRIGAATARVPRCRQRVRPPSRWLGRPQWVEDEGFDLVEHVRSLTLAAPTDSELEAAVARLMAERLDRRRALWRVWVVEGLAERRWAVLALVHHCMVDGIAGSDLLASILDEEPVLSGSVDSGRSKRPPVGPPSAVSGAALGSRRRRGARVVAHPVRAAARPLGVLRAARRLWFRPRHPATTLLGPIGAARRWVTTSRSLADVAHIGAALGGTVNDVVLAAVSSGFRELLRARGEAVENRYVTALIPVSVRTTATRGELGNRVANVHARLPVGLTDPREAVRAVHEELEDLKRSQEVVATGLLMRIGDFVPRVVADGITRAVVRRQRNVETVVTNVPGPDRALSLAGRRMLEGYPIAPIAGQVRITVALWSYCGQLFVGITGDAATASDVDCLRDAIDDGFEALIAAAG